MGRVRVTRVIRRAVVWYSVRNRRAKGRAISTWMDQRGCRTVLLIGTLGRDDTNPNSAIVENAITPGRQVVAGVNIVRCETDYPFVRGDARALPLRSGAADFGLANAIIEHVGDEDDQQRMVDEMTRASTCWVITTPNKWFPIEAHTSTAFLHWAPSWRAKHVDEFSRLLSRREFRRLLPAGTVVSGHWWSPTFTAYYDASVDQARSARPAG